MSDIEVKAVTASSSSAASAPAENETPIQEYYRSIQKQCGDILETSVGNANGQKVSRSRQFVGELEVWCTVLAARIEVDLLKIAAHEYQYALLALCQGH